MGAMRRANVKRKNSKSEKNKLVPKTRKALRKEKRQQKKVGRAIYYQKKSQLPGKYVSDPHKEDLISDTKKKKKTKKVKGDLQERIYKKEKKERQKLEKEMIEQRKLQLIEANSEEDKVIKHLEKQLKLNKRKSKSIPKSFASDGLDYLLDFCDEENRKLAVETEKQLLGEDSGSEFENDFIMATGTSKTKRRKESDYRFSNSGEDESDGSEQFCSEMEQDDSDNKEEQEEEEEEPLREITSKDNVKGMKIPKDSSVHHSDDNASENNVEPAIKLNKSRRKSNIKITEKINSRRENQEAKVAQRYIDEISNSPDEMEEKDEEKFKELWEDIYGRKRDKDGNIVSENSGRYVPPAARLKSGENNEVVESEKLMRLRKQLKGLINRLAEHNMHSIASQIDELYMSSSRNDMNESLSKLMIESIVTPVLTPDRLVTEHMMLVAILHANVGTEVGAHFLLALVKKFDEMSKVLREVENKELDNVVLMISHLYNFKIFGSQLLYQILERLADKFTEKEVELILLILKTVGFVLRKDNPLALKEFVLNLQHKASDAKSENSRVKFMLDVLLAIKNNNMTKIPQYDQSHVEHLKKVMKNFVRKGNYVSQLNISLEDLLQVDERGKWWIVGSAWTGKSNAPKSKDTAGGIEPLYSQKILDLARKQRMNTDVRRNIFCILMTAEDYLDAFEKLHHLGLKDQQEREIVYVIMDCCLQEKKFNAYYAVLAQKLCDYNRKYQMTIQYTLWDKLKALQDYTDQQLSNLARFLIHLFIEKGLPLSVLKVVQFGELDKSTVRLLRQIILGILLHEHTESCIQVFERISISPQLHSFREGLRLFISHFLVKNTKIGAIPEAEKTKLKERAKLVDKALMTRGSRIVF